MSEADAGDQGWAVFTKKKKRRKKAAKKPENDKEGSADEETNQESPVPEAGTTVEEPDRTSPPVLAQPTRPPMKHSAALAAARNQSPVKFNETEAISKAPQSANGKSKVVPTNGAKKKASANAKVAPMPHVPVVEEDGWTTKVTRKNRRRQRKALEAQVDEAGEFGTPDAEDDDQSNEIPSQNTAEENVGVPEVNDEAAAPETDSTEKNKSKKKRKRKKKPADSSQINSKADLASTLKEIIAQHGSNGQLNQNALCNHLSDLTKCSWKQEYKTKYGPMSKFLESNGFSVDNSGGQPVVSITTQPSPKTEPSPSSPLLKKEAPPSQPSAPPNPATKKAKPKNSQTSQPQQGGRESKSTNKASKRKGAKKRRSSPNKTVTTTPMKKQTASWMNTVGLVVLGCASLAALVVGGTKMGM